MVWIGNVALKMVVPNAVAVGSRSWCVLTSNSGRTHLLTARRGTKRKHLDVSNTQCTNYRSVAVFGKGRVSHRL